MMFGKNREVRIRINKTDEDKQEPVVPRDHTKLINTMTDVGKKVVIAGALTLYGYVLVDTYRQVKVAEVVYDRKD